MRWIKLALPLLLLTACTQTEPSIVNAHPLYSALKAEEIVLRDGGDVSRVADLYQRGGTKPVEIVVSYQDGNEHEAQTVAETAQRKLRAAGVDRTVITTIPGSQNRVIALVTALEAGADPSCTAIPGTKGSVAAYHYGDYRLGCAIDREMGKQVARTQDIEGRAPGASYYDDTDGQRTGNIVNDYREGKVNEPLEGLAASDTVEREK